MTYTDIPVPDATAPTFIGAEMLAFSDLDRTPVGGPVLTTLIGAAQLSGRILVAGPHQADLVRSLVRPAAQISWLVRSTSDAVALSAELGQSVRVLCGSVSALAGHRPYDAIVALDGASRLSSVEDVPAGWLSEVAELSSLLRPRGTLLLGVRNLLAVDRRVGILGPAFDSNGADVAGAAAAWSAPAELDPTYPGALSRLLELLRTVNIQPGDAWVGYPSLTRPSALARVDALDSELGRLGMLGAWFESAGTGGGSGSPVWADPARLVALADPGAVPGLTTLRYGLSGGNGSWPARSPRNRRRPGGARSGRPRTRRARGSSSRTAPERWRLSCT